MYVTTNKVNENSGRFDYFGRFSYRRNKRSLNIRRSIILVSESETIGPEFSELGTIGSKFSEVEEGGVFKI